MAFLRNGLHTNSGVSWSFHIYIGLLGQPQWQETHGNTAFSAKSWKQKHKQITPEIGSFLGAWVKLAAPKNGWLWLRNLETNINQKLAVKRSCNSTYATFLSFGVRSFLLSQDHESFRYWDGAASTCRTFSELQTISAELQSKRVVQVLVRDLTSNMFNLSKFPKVNLQSPVVLHFTMASMFLKLAH